jgi:hypothetical protein
MYILVSEVALVYKVCTASVIKSHILSFHIGLVELAYATLARTSLSPTVYPEEGVIC